MKTTEEIKYYKLTNDDYACIEEMAAFYEIELVEAYERFMSGDFDGVMQDVVLEEPEENEK